jgi:hypothetical protein
MQNYRTQATRKGSLDKMTYVHGNNAIWRTLLKRLVEIKVDWKL